MFAYIFKPKNWSDGKEAIQLRLSQLTTKKNIGMFIMGLYIIRKESIGNKFY